MMIYQSDQNVISLHHITCQFRNDRNLIPFLIPHKKCGSCDLRKHIGIIFQYYILTYTKHLKHILKIQLFQNILISIIMLTVMTFATDTAIILGNMNSKHTKW